MMASNFLTRAATKRTRPSVLIALLPSSCVLAAVTQHYFSCNIALRRVTTHGVLPLEYRMQAATVGVEAHQHTCALQSCMLRRPYTFRLYKSNCHTIVTLSIQPQTPQVRVLSTWAEGGWASQLHRFCHVYASPFLKKKRFFSTSLGGSKSLVFKSSS